MAADNNTVENDALIDLPVEDVPVKKVRARRVKKLVVDADGVNVGRIRDGEWREVLNEVGSVEYNRIRLLALK